MKLTEDEKTIILNALFTAYDLEVFKEASAVYNKIEALKL